MYMNDQCLAAGGGGHVRYCKTVRSTMVCLCVQVVLPLVEKYFRAHRAYFITDPNTLQTTETATIREKEMTARSFRIRNLVSLRRLYSPLYLYTRL